MIETPEIPNSKSLGITHTTWQSAKDAIRASLISHIPIQVVTLTPEMCMRAVDDSDFRNAIKNAQVVVADGVGVVWGEGRLTGKRPEKIPGIDLASWALEEVDRMVGTIYLLGAKPEIVSVAAENISMLYPRLKIAGFHDGYFTDDQTPSIISEIASTHPHLLMVGMGSPKQEFFISRNLKQLNCAVAIGVGGSFDVWSGRIKRAPVFCQKTHTEWLYRTITQPGERIKRLPVLMRFVGMVLNKR